MNTKVRITDVSDWEEYERPNMATPYEVVASPMGETISRNFATMMEAQEFAKEIADMRGTYTTSWGEEPYNTETTIILYVVKDGPIRAIEIADKEIDVYDDGTAICYEAGAIAKAKTLPPVIISYNYAPGDMNTHHARRSGRDAILFIEDSWISGRTIIDITEV